MKWTDNLDYMFFRNNYGDKIKLTEKLVPSPGNYCFSCQCSWVNIEDKSIKIDTLTNIDWTCAGHNL
jgi:hypothetical protein